MSSHVTSTVLSLAAAAQFELTPDDLKQLLQSVCQTLGSDIERITQAIETGDIETATKLLHQIKGFAPVFCAPHLSQLIVQAEQLGKQGRLDDLKQIYINLQPALQALNDEVIAFLAT